MTAAVDVAIVSYRCRELLRACLESARRFLTFEVTKEIHHAALVRRPK